MTTNLNNSSLSGKFRRVTFSQSSEHKISNLIEKEFNKTKCSSKSFELIQIAKQHNLSIANTLNEKHNLKYQS